MRQRSIWILIWLPIIILYSCTKTSISRLGQVNAASNAEEAVISFKVSGVLGSNMVIQRDKPFRVWGTAITGHLVTVKVSWNSSTFSATADAAGDWMVTIPSASANAIPQDIVIKDNDATPITLNNILIGEVWVCSGQSNMYMPVDSVGPWFGYEGVVNFQQEIAEANYPLIRLIEIKQDYKFNPVKNISKAATWSVCTPITVKKYSAVAYFFGRKLMTDLNIPVGLVVSSVGGTSCEAWTDKGTIQSDPILNAYYFGKNNASQLFNGMIYPLRNLAIKGFTWYQGENNRHDSPSVNYTRLNSAMINNWRSTFNQGNPPFYFMQMTPYDENFFYGSKPSDNDYAFFREAQEQVRAVTKTGMAVTMDVGDIFRIHPKNKKPVGERLALLALKNDYNLPVQCNGPKYLSFTQAKYKATINFVQGTANGLNTIENQPLNKYFFAAGTDHVFRKCNAVISGDKIIVTAPGGTPLPIQAIRYAFTNYPMTNLQNSSGLPMEPFRTDNW